MLTELVIITVDYPIGENDESQRLAESKILFMDRLKELAPKGQLVKLTEMFTAPANIVKCLADFFTCRDDNEYFTLDNGEKIYFLDCSVKVSDSKHTIAAYNTLEDVFQSLNSFPIIHTLIKHFHTPWITDPNFRIFVKWYIENMKEDDET